MNQSGDVSSSVDQDVPVLTNVTRSSEFLGWIGVISQHLPSPDISNVPSWIAASATAVGVLYAKRTWNARHGLWTNADLDAMINHYCNHPPPITLSHVIQGQDNTTLRLPLNPDVGDLIERNLITLIEGGPGEGKTTQVLRTLFDERFQTSIGQRPLILMGSFRNANLKTELLSRFFGNYKFPFTVADYKTLLRDVVKRAVDRKIPVYIVADDVQQVVDTDPDGEVGGAAQSFFGTLMLLSLKYQDQVKMVYIASRMFSLDLSKFSGHDGRIEDYQWSYDPKLLRDTLEQSNNRTIVAHLDKLPDMFGSRIQDYIRLMRLMKNVDNEEAYEDAVKQMKDECRNNIKNALSAVMKVHGVAGAAEAHKLLTKLLEKQGKAVSSVGIADPNIVDILVRSNIIHATPDVIWASRLMSFVFEERYDEFAEFSHKQTS